MDCICFKKGDMCDKCYVAFLENREQEKFDRVRWLEKAIIKHKNSCMDDSSIDSNDLELWSMLDSCEKVRRLKE